MKVLAIHEEDRKKLLDLKVLRELEENILRGCSVAIVDIPPAQLALFEKVGDYPIACWAENGMIYLGLNKELTAWLFENQIQPKTT